MSIIDDIRTRRSVRTFIRDKVVSENILSKLQRHIDSLTNPFNIDGIDIRIARMGEIEGRLPGTYGVISGADVYAGLATPDEEPMTLVAAAYEFESLVLYATSLGLGTVWLGATFSRDRFAEAFDLPETRYLPAVSPIGYADSIRFTEKIMRKFAKSDKRLPWAQLFFAGNPDAPLSVENAEEYADPLEMVRLAPSATNTQPWRVVRIESGNFRFYADYKPDASHTVYVYRHIDLGIALAHFGLTAQSLGLQGHFIVEEPDTPLPTWHYIATWHPEVTKKHRY